MKRYLKVLMVAGLMLWGSVTLLAALTDNLLFFYQLTSNGNDAVGSVNLTATNSPTFGSTGVDLESTSSQYLHVASDAVNQFGDETFSCGVWVNGESYSGDMNVFSKGNGSSGEYSLQRNPSDGGSWRWEVWGASGFTSNGAISSTFGGINASTLYFLYVYHDAVNNEVGMSVNDGTPITNTHSGGVLAGSGDFEVGAYSAFGNYFDGLIYGQGCWSRKLSASEVTSMYNGGDPLTYAEMGGGGGGGGGGNCFLLLGVSCDLAEALGDLLFP